MCDINRRRTATAARPPIVAAMERQQDYVLRTVEERGVRFVQMWFTDVLGTPKSFQITPAELENALEEGMTFDGSTIDGFSRVQESDVLAMPDAKTFQLLPYLGRRGAGRPGRLRRRQPRRLPVRRRPPPGAAPGPGAGPGPRLFLLRGPRAGVLLLRHDAERRDGSAPVPARPGLLLRPDHQRPGQRAAPRRPCSRSRTWASRSSTASTRTRPASTRSTCATPTP